jgi:hypothetical protein
LAFCDVSIIIASVIYNDLGQRKTILKDLCREITGVLMAHFYISKKEIIKSVKIIRLINTTKEETICIGMCVFREFQHTSLIILHARGLQNAAQEESGLYLLNAHNL